MGSRILVVEDNPDNRILIADVLDSMDYEVIIATDGEEGVKKASSDRPDLILMDISLPQMDGLTATRHIKEMPELKHIPIIALTAHAMVGDRERALEAGCDDYVSKPIDLKELATKLTHFLGQA
ncbi:MAG: response regulator [Chloroflexi bacterium CFX4]|jgi:two-component system response regulator|nr:response regulator [Chloroflexi bacterium CFX4]MDL1923018.1 response regulator [Chloroflexi bacterium CFX3]